MKRRNFLGLLGTTALLGDESEMGQVNGINTNTGAEQYGLLLGSQRPTVERLRQEWDTFNFVFEHQNTGARAYIDHTRNTWKPLNYINHVPVFSSDDLPSPTSGTHTLQGDTVYQFYGSVESDFGLDISNGPVLLGRHDATDGFIHTGGNTAITGNGGSFFARSCHIHSAGGTLFDVSADSQTEFKVESCTFADIDNRGNIADLGTISGFRLPSFIVTIFGSFDAGLTFTGTAERVFIESSTVFNVDAPGVAIITFDSNFQGDLVNIESGAIKSVQSDTVVVHVDPATTVNDIFKYTSMSHDSTVTTDNILTGAAATDSIGYRVLNSYPLNDSKAFIDYTLDTTTETTINTQAASKNDAAAYERIAGGTTVLHSTRFEHADNEATYIGQRDRISNLTAIATVNTGTEDLLALAWFVNGNIVTGTPTRMRMDQVGGGVFKGMTAMGIDAEVTTGDVFDVRVANIDSTTDITVDELNANIVT